jgi:hypothetical protein
MYKNVNLAGLFTIIFIVRKVRTLGPRQVLKSVKFSSITKEIPGFLCTRVKPGMIPTIHSGHFLRKFVHFNCWGTFLPQN